MKSRISIILCLWLIVCSNTFAQFPVTRFDGTVPSYSVDFSGGDLQSLINSVSDRVTNGKNGGTINILPGTYDLRNIKLKSNVHINIHKDVLIRLGTRKGGVFLLESEKNETLENVKIYCQSCNNESGANKPNQANTYTIDLRGRENGVNQNIGINARAFGIGKVSNFHVSDFYILDDNTRISGINLVPLFEGDFDPTDPAANTRRAIGMPEKGDILNGRIDGADYGYGLIQVQVGRDISFKNLHGRGGVTLRLESGAGITYIGTLRQRAFRMENIQAYDINNNDGHAAFMLSPHGRIHGRVEGRKIRSNGSAFCVELAAGFIDREVVINDQNTDPTRFKKGIFKGPVIISDVKGTYKENTAQIKRKNWNFYPTFIRGSSFDNFPGDPAPVPGGGDEIRINTKSIVTCAYLSIDTKGEVVDTDVNTIYSGASEGSGKYEVMLSNVRGVDFDPCLSGPAHEHIVYEGQKKKVCNAAATSVVTRIGDMQDDTQYHSADLAIYPNPADQTINIHSKKGSQISIYNNMGILVQTWMNRNEVTTLNTGGFQSGIYFVMIHEGKEKVYQRKFVIQ